MTKKRISLTIDEKILNKTDRMVGRIADNRSVVFEKLLEKAFTSMIPETAVILAGTDENVLMKTLSDGVVIDRHIQNLGKAGVTQFILVGNELSEVKSHLKERQETFKYVDDKDSGTGGALRETKHLLKESFFLVYGDTVSGVDYADFYRFHVDQQTMATVALATSQEPQKFGVPELKGSRIVGFREKPARTKNYLISLGSFIMEPELLEMIPKGKVNLEKSIIPKLASINQLSGYVFSGEWLDLGGHEQL